MARPFLPQSCKGDYLKAIYQILELIRFIGTALDEDSIRKSSHSMSRY